MSHLLQHHFQHFYFADKERKTGIGANFIPAALMENPDVEWKLALKSTRWVGGGVDVGEMRSPTSVTRGHERAAQTRPAALFFCSIQQADRQTDRRAGQPDSHFTAGLQERLIPGQSPSEFMHRPNTGQTVLHVFSLGSVLLTQATDALTLFTWAANSNKTIKK